VPEPLDVRVVALDVNETLFSLAGLRQHFLSAGLDAEVLPLWFARVLRDGFALTAAGAYAPFAEIGAAVLHDVSGADDATSTKVLAGFRELDPHPDVGPGLRRLREAGLRVVTLTNGSAEVTQALLQRAGLTDLVERPVSVDAVRRWKPAPEPYHHAAETCGVRPEQVMLVAAHAWDVDGAARAGLRTGWLSRLEGTFSPVFTPPDLQASTLDELATLLTEANGSAS